MPPGASGHTKPNAQFLTMDGGKQDSGLWAQFRGDKTRRICHQLMYQGCVCVGVVPLDLHQPQRKDVAMQSNVAARQDGYKP